MSDDLETDAAPPREQRRGLQALGWAVSIICVAGVVWWALRQPAPTFPTSAGDLAWIGLAVVVYALCTLLRGERWRLLLEDVDAHPSRADAIALMAVGYMGNNVLPARAGDVMRVVLMAPRAATTKRHVVGTLLAERLLDIAVLGVMFLVLVFTVAGGAGLPHGDTLILLVVVLVAAVVALGIGVLIAQRRGLLARAKAFIAPMAVSTVQLRGAHGARMLGITVLVWLGEAVVWGSVTVALHLGATPLQALYLVALASMFSLIPSGPGYAGTQDAAAAIGIRVIGGTAAQSVTYIVLVRFVLFVPITLAGLILLGVRYGGMKAFRRQDPQDAVAPAAA